MTKVAFDGRDKPFSDWLRRHPDLDSCKVGLDASDIDFVFQKYRIGEHKHGDFMKSRQVKLMFDLEVKSWGKRPPKPQIETLFFRHQLLTGKRLGKELYSNMQKRKVTVWHFGQFILIMDGGCRPDACKRIQWGRFDDGGEIILTPISETTLIDILSFNLRPDTFGVLSIRLHHAKQVIVGTEYRPDMLFPVEFSVVKCS